MANPYRKIQELYRDCDDVLDMYEQRHRDGLRAKMLMGYVDKWDEVFGKGFFAKQAVKRHQQRMGSK